MSLAVVVVGAVAGLFASLAPRLGRRLRPAVAVRVLGGGSVAVSGSVVFVLGVLAFIWIGQLPQVAELGPWSPTALHHDSPVPDPIAVASAALLGLLAIGATRSVVRRCRSLATVHRACGHLPHQHALVIVDDQRPDAFTTPAPGGRIVVTTGLVRALDAGERRVVLAHEQSHLDHHHPWWTLAADIAAAVNPLLVPTADAVTHAVERWADEDAAAAVADRALAARTLARTALLIRAADAGGGTTAAFVGADVPARVRALLAPPPAAHRGPLVALLALLLCCALATGVVQRLGESLFEAALYSDVGTGQAEHS
jgi:Peptidase family M48